MLFPVNRHSFEAKTMNIALALPCRAQGSPRGYGHALAGWCVR